MNPFLLAFLRGASFRGMNNTYDRVLLSTLDYTSGIDLGLSSGMEIYVDVPEPNMGRITGASGSKITFDPNMDIAFRYKQAIQENGCLWQISAADGVLPNTRKVRLIQTGLKETLVPRPPIPGSSVPQGYTNAGLSRVHNNHGTRYWRGVPKLLPATKLSRHANTGATDAYFEGNCSDYAIGDSIVIGPTNFYSISGEERRTLTSVGAYNATTNETRVFWSSSEPLTEDHWGLLQYPIDAAYGTNAISLAIGAYTRPDADTPTVYDARATVLNMSNGNITVEGPYDADHLAGFGPGLMDHVGCQYHDEGVRIIDGGQRGTLARYPFHSHSLSYADRTSPITFDLTGALIKVNWPNHGIAPVSTQLNVVAFEQDPFTGPGAGALSLRTSTIKRDPSNFYAVTFQQGVGSTLPSGLAPDTVYFLTGTPDDHYFHVHTARTDNANYVAWVNNGTGSTNVANTSISDQPISFTSTGTLPSGLGTGQLNKPLAQFTDQAGTGAGTRYQIVGSTIKPDSFCLNTVPSAGAGSGAHTALYTAFIGDHPECRRVKCTVDRSFNRAYVTHATCGSEISDCIFYDIRGAAFLGGEDGGELRNKFWRNRGIKVRNPVLQSDRLKDFDGSLTNQFFDSSGFWFTHPYNDCQDNIAELCEGSGTHNSYGLRAFGISSLVNVVPFLADILRWKGNGGRWNKVRGALTVDGVEDEFGRSDHNIQYQPQRCEIGVNGELTNMMEGLIAIGNEQGGYFNTVIGPVGPFYKKGIFGDNNGGDVEGKTSSSAKIAVSFLFVGRSLLPASTARGSIPMSPRFGAATYHWDLLFYFCSFHNYPWSRPYWASYGQQDSGGGAMNFRDLYLNATATQRRFMVGNRYNNTHPGTLSREPRLAGYPVTLTLANPCVVSFGSEFQVCENTPIRLTRASVGTGVIPAPLVKDGLYYALQARDGSGNLVAGSQTGVTCKLSLTPGGAAISTAGSTMAGTICMMPMLHNPTEPLLYSMGTTMPDPYCDFGRGSTGTTPRWVCAYGDEPFFAYDAADKVSCEPATSNGVFGLGFSTTDVYVGLDSLITDKTEAGHTRSGMRAVRYDPTSKSVIGTYTLDAETVGQNTLFDDFQSTKLKNRGRYSIRAAAAGVAVPVTSSSVRLTLANDPGIDIFLGIEFSGSVVANKVFRSIRIGSGTMSDRDTGAGMSVACTSGTEAQAMASANGSVFWQDTANNLVWVRWVPLAGNAAYDAYLATLNDTNANKGERASCFVAQHV